MLSRHGVLCASIACAIVVPSNSLAQTNPDAGTPSTPSTQSTSSTPSQTAEAAGPISNLSEGTSRTSTRANVTFSGYVEAFYALNFNFPSNSITNYRGFDNRHNTFTLSNVVLDTSWALGPVTGRLALQVGHTPETYYLSEPTLPGASATGLSNYSVWKILQQANVAWKAPIGRGLLLEAGLFLSPVGPEGMAVKDQWNWSRSILFFGLPFYHTGLRATYGFTPNVSVTLAGYNGWNMVTDNNDEKSIALQFTFNIPDKITFNLLYFTGVERAAQAPEGRAWRHLFDSYLAWYVHPRISLLFHLDGGFEPNNFGLSGWFSGAAYGRFQLFRWLYLALRAAAVWEARATSAAGTAAPILYPSPWVLDTTATLDLRPHDNVSIRLEYRHDHAGALMYFRDAVTTNPMGQFIPNASSQDTLTLGLTTWF